MKFWQNIEMLPSTANAIAKREELCTRTKNEAAVNESMTDTLFPEDDFVQSYVLGVDKSAINFALNSNHGNMVPAIIGCVAYRPIFSNTT